MRSICKDMAAKRRLMNILLLLIHSTIGQKPSAPTNVVMELEFVNGAPKIIGRWNAPLSTTNVTTIEHYLLVVAVNGTSSSNTTVSASTSSVNIFDTFPNIIQRQYTTYSLHVASISSTGQSHFTNPVSVVSNLLQSASVRTGVRKLEASCIVADSKPKTFCIAIISNRTARHAYTFQVGGNLMTLDYAPGEYNVTISVHVMIDGNLVAMQESMFQSIVVPTMVSTSSSLSLSLSSLSSSSLFLMMPSSAMVLPSSSSRPASSLLSKMTSSLLPMLSTPFATSDGNSNRGYGGDGDSNESGEGSLAAVLATILVSTLMLSITIIFTVIVLIWWRQNQRKNSNKGAVATAIKATEKSCIKPTVNGEIDDSPLYEELDTIKDERYSVVLASTKSRMNSVITSNHSSYIEMHPSISINDLVGRDVIMQPNPSYHAVANTNS